MSRRSRLAAVLAVALCLGLMAPAAAQVPDLPVPHPDPAFLSLVPGAPCTVENEYEAAIYGMEVGDVRYEGQCERIRHAFGPIVVKPGENDALLEPVTIEKPAYDGHVVRFKPNLVRAEDGESPPTEDMHLHHATWLSAYPQYGPRIPFFAAGEEKTIATFPEGYGLPVGARDAWLLLYMVHNDNADSDVVWLTYDIDFIAAGDADELGLADIKPVWLDVQGSRVHPESPSTSSNPVFNVQRGFGHFDEERQRQVCTWPRENCARHDTYGLVSPNQGKTVDNDGNPIEIPGADITVGSDWAGTLIGIGGHVHFGGLTVEVSQVRDGVEKPIAISDALYWDWEDRDGIGKVGAHPWSWDFSMTVTGAPDWKVKIREGDILRINTTTDSQDASWYEGMGIAVAYVAPDDPHGPEGIDVFDDDVVIDPGVPTRALTPEGPWDVNSGWRPGDCEPDFEGDVNGQKTLCLRGMATHGPLEESSNHSGGCPEDGCPEFPDAGDGRVTDEIVSAGFTYGDADVSTTGITGIPRIRVGEPTRFWNFDSVARVWHTYTRCEYPCTGVKDMQYPSADGGGFPEGDPMDNVMDFDSNEIGFGTMFEPAAGQLPPVGGKSLEQTVRDSFYWEFTPTEPGVYTFFCRIHKWMRGAVEVVDE